MTTQDIYNIVLGNGTVGLPLINKTYFIATFIATNGQTVFNLTYSPNTDVISSLLINSVLQPLSTYTISGSVLTLVTPSILNDVVILRYYA